MNDSALEDFDWEQLDTNPVQTNEQTEFARKRSGGLGASQIHAICTNRPDYSKIPELEAAINDLVEKIESSKTGKTITAEKELATKQRQLDAILNDSLPAGAKELAKRVAMERITGFCEESDVSFDSPATRWGKKYESEAVEELKKRYPDIELMYTGEEQQSFMFEGYPHVWATPDAVVTVSGYQYHIATLDIKCPFNRSNHFDNLQIEDWCSFMSLHPDYAYQGVCQMLATGANRFWFVSYDPRFTAPHNLIMHQFELNQADVDFMRSRVAMFEAEVLAVMAVMEKLTIC